MATQVLSAELRRAARRRHPGIGEGRRLGDIAAKHERSSAPSPGSTRSFELLRQMVFGAETDAGARLEELRAPAKRHRRTRSRRCARVGSRSWTRPPSATATSSSARRPSSCLADFREVEANFRALDRELRERIAAWDGGKGDAARRGARHPRRRSRTPTRAVASRPSTTSCCRAQRQEEFAELLERVQSLAALDGGDPRMRHIHYDWLDAASSAPRRPCGCCRSSCAASSTIRCGWRTAGSWTCCAASSNERSRCATPPRSSTVDDRRHRADDRAADGAAACTRRRAEVRVDSTGIEAATTTSTSPRCSTRSTSTGLRWPPMSATRCGGSEPRAGAARRP